VIAAALAVVPAASASIQPLGEPFDAANLASVRAGGVGPSGAPDDDLLAALGRLADAATVTDAAPAWQDAVDILEGNDFAAGSPLAGSAYEGIPLLNWDPAGKIQDVPAGGRVTVREVRYGEHAISDTARLHFEDPAQPFSIRYRITELGTSMGGELQPAPLLSDGGTPAPSAVSSLDLLGLPLIPLGSSQTSRFHDPAQFPVGLPGPQPEETRLAVQDFVVDMPAPNTVDAILDPDLRPDHHTLATLTPSPTGPPATAPDKSAGIAAIGDAAPEKQIWSDLQANNPADPAFDITAAKNAAQADEDLVGAMRVRNGLPPGVTTDPAADVTVVLLNNEAYLSNDSLHMPPGAALHVQFVNEDNTAHDVQGTQLFDHSPTIGALDWGSFQHGALDAGGSLDAGATRTVTMPIADDAFTVVLGDPDAGDQASAVLDLDRGPVRQTLNLGGTAAEPQPFASPLHSAEDSSGNLWTALANVDEVVRTTPAANLDNAGKLVVKLPGGNQTAALGGVLAPHAVAVAPDGTIWVTLTLAGAIARIDPSQVHDGTTDGVTIYPLGPCPQCRVPAPPDPQVPLRLPIQMDVTQDGDGNTVVWYAEQGADQIGALRASPTGKLLNMADFGCQCQVPTGIALDRDGHVWFAESVSNRIGRLTPNVTRPFSPAIQNVTHYNIPSSTVVDAADIGLGPIVTSNPHSLVVDRRGRVWWSETETSKLGRLDPALIHPGTTDGISEVALPKNDFGGIALPADIGVDRAGNVYWGDEYGDMIGSVTPDMVVSTRWRPTERQSLTDAPMADSAGNLWFAESGAAILDRVSNVTAGNLRPGPLPVVVADTGSGDIAVSGLREIAGVDVAVTRAGSVVSRVDNLRVGAGGSLRIGAGGRAWDVTGSPILAAGDVVTFTPQGTNTFAPFKFTVADLAASVTADGVVTGHAKLAGAPVFGQVALALSSTNGAAAVNAADGAFGASFAPSQHAGTPGTVTWSTSTQAAVFRTVTPVTGAVALKPAPPGPAPKPAPQPQPRPQPQPQPQPLLPKLKPCNVWLTRHGTVRTLFLLGRRRADVKTCLGGAGASRVNGKSLILGYRGLSVTVRGGLVQSFTLSSSAQRSTPDGAGVGSGKTTLRLALGHLARDSRTRELRAVIAIDAKTAADVRVRMSTRGFSRATRIVVTRVKVSGLDRGGRTLLRRNA
jgi:streptogramin lyase